MITIQVQQSACAIDKQDMYNASQGSKYNSIQQLVREYLIENKVIQTVQ